MQRTLPKIFSRGEGSSLNANLETDRLLIRSINESDLSGLIELQSNEEVMRFVGSGGARSPGRITRIHSNLLALWRSGNPVGGYAVCKKDGTFLGMACLEEVVSDEKVKPGEAEVMIYFKPEFWKQGYAKEVGSGFINCILSAYNEGIPIIVGGKPLTKLVATAEPRNVGSIALQESLGFIRGETVKIIKGDTEVERIKFELDLKKFIKKVLEEKPRSFIEAATAGKYGNIKSRDGFNEL